MRPLEIGQAGARYQLPRVVATNSGTHPFWSSDGTMLFFSPGPEPTQFAVTNVTTQPTVAFGNPARVPRRYLAGSPIAPRRYDIAPDGRFIGLIQPGLAATSQPEIHIVFNWFEELKRLVPTQ